MCNSNKLANQVQKGYIDAITRIRNLIEELAGYADFLSEDTVNEKIQQNAEACESVIGGYFDKYYGKPVWVLYGASGIAKGTIIGKRPTENGGVLVDVQYCDPVSNNIIRSKRVCVVGYDAFCSLIDAEHEASRRLKSFIKGTSVEE